MQEFTVPYGSSIQRMTNDLTSFVLDTKKPAFADFNDAKVVLSLAQARKKDCPLQLAWTVEMALDHSDVIGVRKEYSNMVPGFQALARQKLRELKRLNLLDTKAIVKWLVEIAPVTWCEWAWSPQQSDYIAKTLQPWTVRRSDAFANLRNPAPLSDDAFQDGEDLIASAIHLLSSWRFRYLVIGWIDAARQWCAQSR